MLFTADDGDLDTATWAVWILSSVAAATIAVIGLASERPASFTADAPDPVPPLATAPAADPPLRRRTIARRRISGILSPDGCRHSSVSV